jgi:chemotaxis protein methyltransferase CheR
MAPSPSPLDARTVQADTEQTDLREVMPPQLFKRFVRLTYEKAGISIRPGKEALVTARIAKRQRALSITSAEKYLEYLEKDSSGQELNHFLDVISTHFTSFFREPEHFVALRQEIEHRLSAGQRRFRIWSAASSTGEEPFSMAMTLLDTLAEARKEADLKILATDISLRSLEEARAGVYPGPRVALIPQEIRQRHLEPVDATSDLWRVSDRVRRMVTFKRINLSTPPFPMRGPLDVVFCRNVLIYFDQPTRQRLATEIERLLGPSGLLCVGHTETLNGISTRLKILRPSMFRAPATKEISS